MIEVKNLVKRYGDHTAVDHLSFEIEKGKIYGFLGPNGAGKSTTMNMITGYIASTEGTVVIDGHDILEEPEEAKKCIGYLPEMPPLYFDMTVLEYLKFVADLKKITKLPLSVHMELVRPETFLPMFAKAGADIITFQLDACPNPLHMLREVKKAGIKAGLGIGPSYDVERLRYLLPHIDGLILMSVEPGYGGQPFEESIYEKVKRSVEIMDETGIHVPISIDGGVNTVTGKKLVEAGADILIAGSSVFGADSITDAVKSLKAL